MNTAEAWLRQYALTVLQGGWAAAWREGVNYPNHTWTHTDPSARETM